MTYLLDTNTCIRYINGQSPTVRQRLQALRPADVAVCARAGAINKHAGDALKGGEQERGCAAHRERAAGSDHRAQMASIVLVSSHAAAVTIPSRAQSKKGRPARRIRSTTPVVEDGVRASVRRPIGAHSVITATDRAARAHPTPPSLGGTGLVAQVQLARGRKGDCIASPAPTTLQDKAGSWYRPALSSWPDTSARLAP